MDYLIEFPADLKITGREFVQAWNDDKSCSQIATARVARENVGQYDAGIFSIPVIIGTIAVHITAAAIYDSLRDLFTRKGVKNQIEFELSDQPDGTRKVSVKIQ